MKLPIFTTFVLFALVVRLIAKRNTKSFAEANNEFWEHEREANSVRRKPIDDLPYITIPDRLPIHCLSDEASVEYARVLQELSEKKILNLTGFTNTELKFKYGAPNITFLTECDLNYTILVRTIAFLAEKYLAEGLKKEAKTLLEYGISVGSDVRKNYELLASIYAEKGEYAKIQGLIDQAGTLNSLSKEPIIRSLEGLLPRNDMPAFPL